MTPKTVKLDDDVIGILRRSTIDGNILKLPGQLDRPTYVKVDKALKAAGGRWERKLGGHLFAFDPHSLLGTAVEDGEVVDRKKTLQFFETPADLAARMVEIAELGPGKTALEPSAGHGRILREILATGAQAAAVEVDETNIGVLKTIAGDFSIYHEPFELFQERGTAQFDAVLMNPPFAGGADIQHIMGAWKLVKPGGRLVAICCEGPFFREDKASIAFRQWLDEIEADDQKLPHGTFRESGTDVATRLVWAYKPVETDPEKQLREIWDAKGVPLDRQAELIEELEAKANPLAMVGPFQIPTAPPKTVQLLPMDQVQADPGQPRKEFEETSLRELAASIRKNGLLQPISVRKIGPNMYQIVAGERRFRAHEILRAETIPAIVIDPPTKASIRIAQIVENDQRQDVTPLEQAHSYQDLMEEEGWTVEELATHLGKAPHRIKERTDLLKLDRQFQQLLASGNLKPSQAFEMSRLSSRGQHSLFAAIRTGQCENYNNLRAISTALVETEAQLWLVPDEPVFNAPTEQDRTDSRAFENRVEQIAAMLRAGIRDNQIEAVKKVDPNKARHLADLLGAMQTDLRRIEVALRQAAAQATLLFA